MGVMQTARPHNPFCHREIHLHRMPFAPLFAPAAPKPAKSISTPLWQRSDRFQSMTALGSLHY
jgi:hypothetical protein